MVSGGANDPMVSGGANDPLVSTNANDASVGGPANDASSPVTAAQVTAGWSSTTVTATDGTALHVWRAGRSGGLPIVLAHGLSDDGRCWWRVADELLTARDDLDLVVPDARNHGRSGTGDNDAALLVADIVAVLDALDLRDAIGIGHSMGARTLAHTAATHPDRIRQLVLVDPPWRAKAEHDATFTSSDRDAIRAWIDSMRAATDDELAIMGRTQHPDWPAEDLPPWVESSRRVRPEAADIDGRVPWGEIVDRLSCPTVLLYGESDRGGIVTEGVANRLAQRHSNVTTHRVAGAGHNLHRERFAEVVGALLDHLPNPPSDSGSPTSPPRTSP